MVLKGLRNNYVMGTTRAVELEIWIPAPLHGSCMEFAWGKLFNFWGSVSPEAKARE
jgi:hypothetical protein